MFTKNVTSLPRSGIYHSGLVIRKDVVFRIRLPIEDMKNIFGNFLVCEMYPSIKIFCCFILRCDFFIKSVLYFNDKWIWKSNAFPYPLHSRKIQECWNVYKSSNQSKSQHKIKISPTFFLLINLMGVRDSWNPTPSTQWTLILIVDSNLRTPICKSVSGLILSYF